MFSCLSFLSCCSFGFFFFFKDSHPILRQCSKHLFFVFPTEEISEKELGVRAISFIYSFCVWKDLFSLAFLFFKEYLWKPLEESRSISLNSLANKVLHYVFLQLVWGVWSFWEKTYFLLGIVCICVFISLATFDWPKSQNDFFKTEFHGICKENETFVNKPLHRNWT